MRVLRASFEPGAFLERVGRARARVLLVDYDGTLAPFRVDPAEARPYAGVAERLQRVRAAGTRLVVVSGRPAREVRGLLALRPSPEVWGAHGWERSRPGEDPAPVDLPERVRSGLAEGAERVAATRGRGRLERKPASVAVHVRGLEPGEAERVVARARAAWEPVARRRGLELRTFDGGLELRARGRDKGDVVREVLGEVAEGTAEPADVAAAYLGDDDTDEDAFRAMRGRGASLLVRPELRETAADAWIRPPGELLELLDDWIAAATS